MKSCPCELNIYCKPCRIHISFEPLFLVSVLGVCCRCLDFNPTPLLLQPQAQRGLVQPSLFLLSRRQDASLLSLDFTTGCDEDNVHHHHHHVCGCVCLCGLHTGLGLRNRPHGRCNRLAAGYWGHRLQQLLWGLLWWLLWRLLRGLVWWGHWRVRLWLWLWRNTNGSQIRQRLHHRHFCHYLHNIACHIHHGHFKAKGRPHIKVLPGRHHHLCHFGIPDGYCHYCVLGGNKSNSTVHRVCVLQPDHPDMCPVPEPEPGPGPLH